VNSHVWKSVNNPDGKQAGTPFFFDGPVRLGSLLLVAVFVSMFLATGNVTADALFQSPQSPVEEPAPPPEQEQQPPAQPEEATPEAAPPTAEQPPADDTGQEPAEVVPDDTAPVDTAPADSEPPAENNQAAPTVAPDTQPPPVVASTPLPPARQEAIRPGQQAEDSDGSSLILDEAEMIDTLVVSFAYVWLCCGIVIILLIPLIFLFLQIRGRSKISREG
jgi:hypothetical protein